jgi:hypothetical protein
MNSFEDQLWSDLVAEHAQRMRGADLATAALAADLDEGPRRPTRKRRRAGVAGLLVSGAVAGTALTLGLFGVLGRAPVHSAIPSAPGAIRTSSYTLISNTTGTVTLTINPKELFDAAALQSDLARYGIPAKVTTGSFCSSNPEPAGFSQVVSGQPNRESTVQVGTGEQPTITFDPSAIPAGAELSFGNFQLASGQQQADLALIDSSADSCSSNPADAWSAYDSGILYGGPVGS